MSVCVSFHDTCEILNDLYRLFAKNTDYLSVALPRRELLLLDCASVAQVKLATGHSTV